jgi:hypothetical protein
MLTNRCSMPSVTQHATSAQSAPARWPSSCTTAPATASRWFWQRSSRWGSKPGVEPLGLWEVVRTGARARSTASIRFLPNKFDPPSFALKLGHKDMRLATELRRELGVPMRLANMAFAEMTEALNRGWENRDSRSPALLQLERCGLKVEVDPRRIQEVLDRDPLHGGPNADRLHRQP